MKKLAAIQISIPEPCTQAWDDMQPVQGGRHCAHCRKVVVDFSKMTDALLLAYFQKPDAADCGRFTTEQLERTIKVIEVPRSAWWTKVAAGLLLALGLSKNVNAQSKISKEIIEQNAFNKERQSATSTNTDSARGYEIYGTLKDEHGNPVVNANVEISSAGILKARDLTDFDGNYSIKPLEGGIYDVKFSYLGRDVTYTEVATSKNKVKVNGLSIEVRGCPFSVGGISRYGGPILQPPGQRTISGEMLDHIH